MALRVLIVIAVVMAFVTRDLAVAQGVPAPGVGNRIVPAPVRVQQRIDRELKKAARDRTEFGSAVHAH